MRTRITVLITLFCLLAVQPASSQSNSASPAKKQIAQFWEQSSLNDGKVGVIEGNTVIVFDGETIGVVTKNGDRYTIRLRGIDAPEPLQPFAQESATQLEYTILGMNVVAIIGEKDQRNRYIGAVFIEGEDVSLAQLQKGMAWYHANGRTEMPKEQKDAYSRAEKSARDDRSGLWSAPAPIAPWVFRGEDVETDEARNTSKVLASKGQSVRTETSPIASPPTTIKTSTTNSARKYVLGPQGGCYYLNDRGAKIYVRNKELCNKP